MYSKDKIYIKFTKTNIIFYLILHDNVGESCLDVCKTEICKFKMHINIPWYKFCLGSISEYFTKDEMSEISLNSTVYDYSVDHSAIEEEDILNIYEYLMKNNIR